MRGTPGKTAQHGQGVVEYGLILVLAVVVVLVVLQALGVSLQDVFCRVAGGLGGGVCTAGKYCTESFDSLENWANSTGWTIQEGKACNTKDGELRMYNTCSQKNKIPKDYVVTVDSAVLYKGNGYGVFFRQQSTNPTTGYVFQYDPGYKGFIFRKWVNGWELSPPFAVKAAPNFDWWNTNHKIKVEVKGSTFRAYVDDELVLTGTDTTYTEGGVGLRTWDSTRVCLDDLAISDIP